MESRMADDTWPPPAAAFSPIDHSRPSSQAGPARSGISAGIAAIQEPSPNVAILSQPGRLP